MTSPAVVITSRTARPNPAEPVPTVVLSLGMGADSAALLTRWLLEPDSRDFDLADLLVITSQTGDEWELTGQLMEAHLLPLMAEHRVRYVQVARAGRLTSDGVRILADTRTPDRIFLEGDYKLSQEMLAAGTVPQSGGARRCSVRSKGDMLDLFLAAETQGAPFRHIIGFESGETGRAERDSQVRPKPGLNRNPSYPLIDWDWDRAACEQYLRNVFGVDWMKSACQGCPFSFGSKAGRARMVELYRQHPVAGARVAYGEHLALALNPTQGLLAGDRLSDLLHEHELTGALDALEVMLAGAEHAVYEVRRVFTRRRDGKYNSARKIERRARGSRTQMRAQLQAAGLLHPDGILEAVDGVERLWLRHRAAAPAQIDGEHYLVVAPADAEDKQGPAFAAGWSQLTDPEPALFGMDAFSAD